LATRTAHDREQHIQSGIGMRWAAEVQWLPGRSEKASSRLNEDQELDQGHLLARDRSEVPNWNTIADSSGRYR